MNPAQSAIIAVLCIFGSVAGGVLGSAFFSPSPTDAQEKAPVAPEVVKAQEFVLVDGKGRTKARLATSDEGTVQFELLDSIARPRLRLQCEDKGASIGVVGRDGKENIYFASYEDDESDATVLLVNGVNDLPVFSIQHRGEQSDDRSKLEETYIGMYDRQANPRLLIGWNGDQVAQFNYFDSKGDPTVRLAATGDMSSLELNSTSEGGSLLSVRSGEAHLMAGASEKMGTSLQHWHGSKLRLGAQTMDDGSPVLKMLNARGEVTWEQRSEEK